MNYEEEIAKLLIERFGIPKGTMVTWKRRGGIPKKYFDEDGNPKTTLQKPDSLKRAESIVIEVLGNSKLHKGVILSRCEVPAFAYNDATRSSKRVQIKSEYVIKLKQELLDLRRDLKAAIEPIRKKGSVSEKTSTALIDYVKSEERIRLRPMMDPDFKNYERIVHVNQRVSIEDEAVWSLISSIEVLILEMKIA